MFLLGAAGPVGAEGPSLHRGEGASAPVEVHGLSGVDLAALQKDKRSREDWIALFAVYVTSPSTSDPTPRPPVLGTYSVEGDVLRFSPRFPWQAGLRYRGVFQPARLPGHPATQKPVVQEFTLANMSAARDTAVERVYPSSALLPENQLRFYLHFTAPMSRGEAYAHLRLLDAAGKQIAAPFLELDEELWDPAGKRFTLFLDPGRVKRDLKPRQEAGPVLEEGKSYTLVLDRSWPDARGRPLKESFRKSFRVGPPENRPIDPKDWKVQPPRAGTTQPLVVNFPRPLDRALLERVLQVTDAAGQSIKGTATATEEEKRWTFTPPEPWQAGEYTLRVGKTLEDLAGNRLGRPFEVDLVESPQQQTKVETVQVPFRVVASGSR